MKERMSRDELTFFAISTLAENLVAGGLKEEEVIKVSYVFKKCLSKHFEKTEWNQTG